MFVRFVVQKLFPKSATVLKEFLLTVPLVEDMSTDIMMMNPILTPIISLHICYIINTRIRYKKLNIVITRLSLRKYVINTIKNSKMVTIFEGAQYIWIIASLKLGIQKPFQNVLIKFYYF